MRPSWVIPMSFASSAISSVCPEAARLPSREFGSSGICGLGLSQPVLAFDFMLLQATDARQWAATVGNRDSDHDFIGARRIGNPDLDCVEMAAHESRILMAERHIDGAAEPTHLFGRRHQGG